VPTDAARRMLVFSLMALWAMPGQGADAAYRLRTDPGQYQVQSRPGWKLPPAPTTNPATDARPFAESIAAAAAAAGIETELLHAVVKAESAYRSDARSDKGAIGLTQLMPGTAARYDTRALTHADRNLLAGARYLRTLLDQFDNTLPLALAAYNAGPGVVIRYQGIPPYPETRAYVARVMTEYRALKGARYALPQPWQLGSSATETATDTPPGDG